MRKAIVSGVMLALLAGTAMAQSAPAAVPANPAAMDSTAKAPPPPPPGPGAMDDRGPDGGMPGGPMPGGPGPGGPRGNRPPPPPPPARAAHFRLERGDTALDVKCAEDEPMKNCADIAMQLLDKMQTLPTSKP